MWRTGSLTCPRGRAHWRYCAGIDLALNGVSEAEVESAYRRIRADIVFGNERISAHMNRLGNAELIRGSLTSQAEALRKARAVSATDIVEIARELASQPRSLVTVGPVR